MISIELDTAKLDAAMERLGKRVMDGTIPLSRLDRAVKLDMALAVNNNAKATGGTVRGERWPGFAPQYTRKDGTVVPAWGGVSRADGNGTVQGKKRPSGTRVAPTSIITRDTGEYVNALVSSPPRILNKNELVIGGPQLTEHGEHQNEMRPLVRWNLPHDQDVANKIGNAYLDELAREASK